MTLTQRLDWLIDQWCERRALRPLQVILRAYPAVLAHTDQFGDVLNALREVKKLCGPELPPEELDQVVSCVSELQGLVERRLR